MLVQENIGRGLSVGLGATQPQLQAIAASILAKDDVGNAQFLSMQAAFDSLTKEDADLLKILLLQQGADPSYVRNAYRVSGHARVWDSKYATWWAVLGTASMAASAYHGWKRTGSWGWTLGWAFMGGLFPVFTPVVALAQGFGKPKR